ncbi:MAG: amino acid ABC transporter permease [Actinobacteria bacterium]|nr:amino acid ABC transporter permease [Actinomycetota bacterium]
MNELWGFIVEYTPYILKGLPGALLLVIVSAVLSIIIGLIAAFGRLSRNKIINLITTFYIESIRGTPPILQILIIYFGLASIGLKFDRFTSSVIFLSVLYGAFAAEVFRGGIVAVDVGQMEAALSLGMNRRLAMRRVILPQAIKIILPPMGNFIISLFKDTSLVLIIAYAEITYRAYSVASITYRSMPAYLIAGIIYLIISLGLSRLVKYMERKMRTA